MVFTNLHDAARPAVGPRRTLLVRSPALRGQTRDEAGLETHGRDFGLFGRGNEFQHHFHRRLAHVLTRNAHRGERRFQKEVVAVVVVTGQAEVVREMKSQLMDEALKI